MSLQDQNAALAEMMLRWKVRTVLLSTHSLAQGESFPDAVGSTERLWLFWFRLWSQVLPEVESGNPVPQALQA